MDSLPPCANMEDDGICEDIEYAFKDVSPPKFLSKENVINDTPTHQIIITLRHEIMVMSGSQPVTHVLC